jgi:putative RNase toxin 4 of polymorphic toxin system
MSAASALDVTAEFERRLPDGSTVIRARLGGPQTRLHLERRLLPAVKVGLKGWHRSHAIGAGVGAERGGGILYAPPRVNLELQNA